MSNLERLFLSLIIDIKHFVDGNCLNNDIINHLTKLNDFQFNIYSRIYDYNQNDIRSNEDIQSTFKIFPKHKVISCIDYFSKEDFCQCHYYSYPYQMTNYDHITNNFPGGIFNCVRKISLFDEYPFEHRFFIKLSKAFPFITYLKLVNFKAPQEKSNDDNEYLSIIKYSHLTELHIIEVHHDYVEQFLLHSKCIFSKQISVWIHYNALKRVTNHFTRDQTRINSAKIKHFSLLGRFQSSKQFEDYFCNLETYAA